MKGNTKMGSKMEKVLTYIIKSKHVMKGNGYWIDKLEKGCISIKMGISM